MPGAGIRLGAAEDSGGEVEDGGDEGEGASYDDAYQAEGEQDEPDKWIEDQGGEREWPAEEGEDQEEQEVEHRIFLSLKDNACGGEKVPAGG